MHSPEREEEWIEKYRAALDGNPIQPSRLARARGALRRTQQTLVAEIGRMFGIRNGQPIKIASRLHAQDRSQMISKRGDVQPDPASPDVDHNVLLEGDRG
jgi:hypothetical protein